MTGKSHPEKGIIALVVLTAAYGMTAVMARYFSDQTEIFEQWYIRFSVAALVLPIIFRRQIRFRRLLTVSAREKRLTILRALIGFVLATWLYAWASQHAKIGSVAAMQVVPTTALLGVWLLHEKLSLPRVALIAASFMGALCIVLHQPTDLLSFGRGELASLAAGALFSLSFVLRKRQTGELNNYELSFVITLVGVIANYILSVVSYRRLLPQSGIWSPRLGMLFVLAGVLSVAMNLLMNYGFEHVKATVASVIMNLELVFGVLFGYLLYHEVLSLREYLGAGVILACVIGISRLDARQKQLVHSTEQYNE